jgi:hypothetical protein
LVSYGNTKNLKWINHLNEVSLVGRAILKLVSKIESLGYEFNI